MSFRYPLSASYYAEQVFEAGFTFTDGERTARNARELQELFCAHGANELACRIGTSRHKPQGYDDDTSLDAAVGRAEMARELGIPLNPLIFLSRHYGDMTGQPHPSFDGYPELALDKPWEEMHVDEMAAMVERFSRIVAEAIVATGVRVDVWNLGNEVDFGIAGVTVQPIPMGQWDEVDGEKDWYRGPAAIDPDIGKMSANALFERPFDDRVKWLRNHVWPHEARLLGAAADGVRAVVPDARFSTHLGNMPIERGWATSFFAAMKDGGYHVDVPGISVYTAMSETPDEALVTQRGELSALIDQYGTAVIQEFGYPAGRSEETFADAGIGCTDYPLTEDGQARFCEDFFVWGVEAGLSGIVPWGPDLIWPVWEKMTFFRVEGMQAIARPALLAFEAAMQRVSAAS